MEQRIEAEEQRRERQRTNPDRRAELQQMSGKNYDRERERLDSRLVDSLSSLRPIKPQIMHAQYNTPQRREQLEYVLRHAGAPRDGETMYDRNLRIIHAMRRQWDFEDRNHLVPTSG